MNASVLNEPSVETVTPAGVSEIMIWDSIIGCGQDDTGRPSELALRYASLAVLGFRRSYFPKGINGAVGLVEYYQGLLGHKPKRRRRSRKVKEAPLL